MKEQRELFREIKSKYPKARESESSDGTKRIIFGIYIVVYQFAYGKELYSLIIQNESVQNEKEPQKIWDSIKKHELENTSRNQLIESVFKTRSRY